MNLLQNRDRVTDEKTNIITKEERERDNCGELGLTFAYYYIKNK